MVKLNGKEVGPLGFGLMGFTWRENPVSFDQAIETMRETLNQGVTFWNGGEFYGPPERNSLQLLNAYFTKYPEDAERVTLSIKGGMDIKSHKPGGDETTVRASIDNCLKLLGGKKSLDLFECARVDPNTPIEETVRVLAECVKEGKIGGFCLSEASASTIRRAAKVAKVAAVEVEYSLFDTEIVDNGIVATCAELDIPVVAYSPLSKGFLTGGIRSRDDLPHDSMLRHFPRFSEENFDFNMQLVHEVEKIAQKKGCKNTQVALAWIRYQSGTKGKPEFLPIPGATTVARVQENFKDVTLDDDEFKELDEAVKKCEVKGARYPEHVAKMAYVETKEL